MKKLIIIFLIVLIYSCDNSELILRQNTAIVLSVTLVNNASGKYLVKTNVGFNFHGGSFCFYTNDLYSVGDSIEIRKLDK